MCDWFETKEFKKLSTKNTSSKKKQKVPHCCGSKQLVRYREELNAMNVLHSTAPSDNSPPLTENQTYDKVIGVRCGYVHGLGHGQDPFPSSVAELDNMEVAHRNAQEAERRAEEAERHAQEALRLLEESKRQLEESERRTNEKIQTMQGQMHAQMQNFLSQLQGNNLIDMLTRSI